MKYSRQVQGALDRLDQSLASLHTMVKRGQNKESAKNSAYFKIVLYYLSLYLILPSSIYTPLGSRII